MNNKPVIEILIRSNIPNVGKTFIAARLSGVMKDEFGATTLIDSAQGDIQNAIFVINENGVPNLNGVTVLIRDEDHPIDPGTVDKINAELPNAVQMRRHPNDILPGEEAAPTPAPDGVPTE